MAFFSRVREAIKPKKKEATFNDLQKIPSVDSLPSGSSNIRETGIKLYSKSDSFYDFNDESQKNDAFTLPKPLKKTSSFSLATQQVPDESDKENSVNENSNRSFFEPPSSGKVAFESVKDSRFASTRFAREPPSFKAKVITDEQTIFDDEDFFEPLPALSMAFEEFKASSSSSYDDYDFGGQQQAQQEEKVEQNYQEEEVEEEAEHLEFINTVFSKARHDRQDYVLELLEQGAFAVNCHDSFGNTLLHICAQNNNRRLAAKILKRCPQANINARNYKSFTPLDFSDKYGFAKLSEWLITMGAVHGPSQRKLRQEPPMQDRRSQFMSMR